MGKKILHRIKKVNPISNKEDILLLGDTLLPVDNPMMVGSRTVVGNQTAVVGSQIAVVVVDSQTVVDRHYWRVDSHSSDQTIKCFAVAAEMGNYSSYHSLGSKVVVVVAAAVEVRKLVATY
jgi:hypothetical protein